MGIKNAQDLEAVRLTPVRGPHGLLGQVFAEPTRRRPTLQTHTQNLAEGGSDDQDSARRQCGRAWKPRPPVSLWFGGPWAPGEGTLWRPDPRRGRPRRLGVQ